MLSVPAKANELFDKLASTSDRAIKTREILFSELKSELEIHSDLEEKYLFPVLRKQPQTKDLVASALNDNRELRKKLDEVDGIPKNDENFLLELAELRKKFRQHARDEKKALIPAVQEALSDEQAQSIAEKMERGLAEADQAESSDEPQQAAGRDRRSAEQDRSPEAPEASAKHAPEESEPEAQQADAGERQRAAERRTRDAIRQSTEAAVQTAGQIADSSSRVAGAAARTAERAVTAPLSTGSLFWDAMFGMWAPWQGRSVSRPSSTQPSSRAEEVIPLAEETLTVGKKTVESGTTRVRRYIVETPVEEQVSLYDERVVVERRRPVTDAKTGEVLTELTVEMVETSEVPVVAKGVRVREEVVVRRERTRRVATVRETLRHDEIEIEGTKSRKPALAHSRR